MLAATSNAFLPVLHAEHVGDAHDVVVHVVADRRGVADRRSCSWRRAARSASGEPFDEAERAEAQLAGLGERAEGCRRPPTSRGATGRAASGTPGARARGSRCPRRSTSVLPHLRDLGDRLAPHRLRLVDVGDVEAVDLGGRRCRGRCRTRSGCSVRWSSSATFSAMRTGLFTGGVMLKIAEPRCTRSVCAAQKAEERLGPGHVRVLVEEVVLRAPHVLEARCWSAALAISTLRMMRLCSALGSTVALELRARTAGRRRRTPWLIPFRGAFTASGTPSSRWPQNCNTF